jgi:ribosomal protein S13
MDRKMSEKELNRFMKLAGLLKENNAEQIVDKVEPSIEAKLDQLSPEQIQKLQADLAKLGITADTAVEDAAQKIEGSLDEAEGDDKKKLANALSNIGTGLIGSLLVPIIPLAIGHGTGLGVASGFGITLAAGGLLVGLAKALEAKGGNQVKEDDYSEDPSSDTDDESQSGDTDVMDIDEAGNVKGITIQIPGNSHAGDFGKAAAREVIESFGPREAKHFIEAFVAEIKKLAGGA